MTGLRTLSMTNLAPVTSISKKNGIAGTPTVPTGR